MRRNLPTIPAGEYRERWSKVHDLMDKKGLDLFFAYADDRATFGPAHARWFANFPVHFEVAGVLIAKGKDPILVSGPESEGYAKLVGSVSDVRVIEEFTHPYVDFMHAKFQKVSEVVSDLIDLKKIKRIGIAGASLMGAYAYLQFQEAFPGAEWVDVEYDVCMLRAIKSDAELAVIRHAYSIAQRGIEVAIDAIKDGAFEREVAALVEYTIRMAGAEGTGVDTMVGSGENARDVITRTSMRQMKEGEFVHLTVAPRYEGYHGAIARPIFIGEPNKEALTALLAAERAHKAGYAALKPGIEGRVVEDITRQIMNEEGLEKYYQHSDMHSIGVMEFEPPFFGPTQDSVFAERMVVSIDVPVFETPWGGFRVEDGYLITATGAERLNLVDYFIIK
ncbi:MAG: aminopeptidase P family protein [Spirochaetales bacterium]|nr:aminopeptidase P family protein [Spirochaetales bacterium]